MEIISITKKGIYNNKSFIVDILFIVEVLYNKNPENNKKIELLKIILTFRYFLNNEEIFLFNVLKIYIK